MSQYIKIPTRRGFVLIERGSSRRLFILNSIFVEYFLCNKGLEGRDPVLRSLKLKLRKPEMENFLRNLPEAMIIRRGPTYYNLLHRDSGTLHAMVPCLIDVLHLLNLHEAYMARNCSLEDEFFRTQIS